MIELREPGPGLPTDELAARVTLGGALWERLALAAYLGHEPAQRALLADPEGWEIAHAIGLTDAETAGVRGKPALWIPPVLARGVGVLGFGGRRACVAAAVSAARCAASGLEGAGLRAALAALLAAEAWLARPSIAAREAAEAASDAALVSAARLAKGAAVRVGAQLLQMLWDEAQERARLEQRSMPAGDGPAEEAPSEDAAVGLLGAVRACALAARIAALPVLAQDDREGAGDPEVLLRVALSEAATVVGREVVDAAVLGGLLPRCLGEHDPAEVLELARLKREVDAALGADRAAYLAPETSEPEKTRLMDRIDAGRSRSHELWVQLEAWWWGEPEWCWRPQALRRVLQRSGSETRLDLGPGCAYVMAGLVTVPALVALEVQGLLQSALARNIAGVLGFALLVVAFRAPIVALFEWRYRPVRLVPAALRVEVLEGRCGVVAASARLSEVRGWRRVSGGLLLSVPARGWWRSLLSPLYIPTPTPEDRALVERFLRGDVRELMREAQEAR